MKVMLDTNICIYLIKKQPLSVLDRFAECAVGDVGLSVMTLAELEYGASKSRHPIKNRAALELFIAPLEVVDFGRSATLAYGRVRAILEDSADVLEDADFFLRPRHAPTSRHDFLT